jgi:hypothetical protein
LRAVEATLDDWKKKVRNYEEDLSDTNLRGDTRSGIRNLLNSAYAMVEQLEKDRAELVMFSVDRDRERAEYDKVWRGAKRSRVSAGSWITRRNATFCGCSARS